MYSLVKKHFKQALRNISFVAVKFAEEFLFQHFKDSDITVIGISRRKVKTEDFPLLVADKMQFEAVEPAHGTLFALGKTIECFVIENALVVTNAYFCAVHKADTGAFSETDDVQKKHHRGKHFVFNGYKTIVGQLLGETPKTNVRRCRKDKNA